MLGIIFLMPLFQDALKIKSVYLKPVADLVLLSVAVQITLLPLLIYHFQTLPVYFVFANLLVVPAVALIMYAGILFLLLPENKTLNFVVDILVMINDSCCNMMCDWPYPMIYVNHQSLVDYSIYALSVVNLVMYYEWKVNAFLWLTLIAFTSVFI
jgi:competence protein ComEC